MRTPIPTHSPRPLSLSHLPPPLPAQPILLGTGVVEGVEISHEKRESHAVEGSVLLGPGILPAEGAPEKIEFHSAGASGEHPVLLGTGFVESSE